MLFDMYILAWLHELRNQYNLATCWPQPANSKMAGAGGEKPLGPVPPLVEIFLVLGHQ